MTRDSDPDPDLRDEYDFSGGVRAKYAAEYAKGVEFHILSSESPSTDEPRSGGDAETVEWALWRQDDNGNRALMRRFATRGEAEREQRAYEARGHKQTYWVEPVAKLG